MSTAMANSSVQTTFRTNAAKAFKHLCVAGVTVAGLSVMNTDAVQASTLVLDQIGSNASYATGSSFASQDFEAAFDAFDVARIDDFTTTSVLDITKVEGIFNGFGGFTPTGYSAVQNWRVEIYSSVTAAASNLIGDIASFTFLPSEVTLTQSVNGDPVQALVSIATDIRLSTPGTYWLGIIPTLDFTGNGQLGVRESTMGSGALAAQVNPNSGFGFTSSSFTSAAYRLEGKKVPEPASVLGLLAIGTMGAGSTLKRKKKGDA